MVRQSPLFGHLALLPKFIGGGPLSFDSHRIHLQGHLIGSLCRMVLEFTQSALTIPDRRHWWGPTLAKELNCFNQERDGTIMHAGLPARLTIACLGNKVCHILATTFWGQSGSIPRRQKASQGKQGDLPRARTRHSKRGHAPIRNGQHRFDTITRRPHRTSKASRSWGERP